MLEQGHSDGIGVIGYGRLGRALVGALGQAVGAPCWVASGHGNKESTGPGYVSTATLLSRSRWVFLAVPDVNIEEVAVGLAVGPEHTVVHCSGSTPLSVLQSAADRGAHTASFHPLQAFPTGSDAGRFNGITVGIEAAEPAYSRLTNLAKAMGAEVLSLNGVDRTLYHAGAVLVSNQVVALMKAAADAWGAAGLEGAVAQKALLPLLRGAVESMAENGMMDGLTGPLLRGDVETVSGHLAALRAADPLLEATYAPLSKLLLRLGVEVGGERRGELNRLLQLDAKS